MKKIILLFSYLILTTISIAAIGSIVPGKKATEIFLIIGKQGERISLMDLTQISAKDYQTISGKHMSLLEKATFKLSQKKLARCINNDGTINNRRLIKMMDDGDGSSGFDIVGFALGLFIPLLGVLLAYVISNDENRRNRVMWAWRGFGVFAIIWSILFLALLGKGFK